jgi:hypothetical protein
MRRYVYWFSLAFAVLGAAQVAAARDPVVTCPDICPTFSLTVPDISGPAGSTVGWGYSITNNSTTNYLDISAIDASVFLYGTADSSIFPYTFSFGGGPLAPGTTQMESFATVDDNIEDDLGLFQDTLDAGAPVGATDAGYFGLEGAFCDPIPGDDPNNPTGDTYCAEDGVIPGTLLATADYSVTVSPSSTTAAPEPSSFLLLLSGLCSIGLCPWRRQRTSAWPATPPQ